ncbi:carbon-nitrogen hydrolase family protein [Congregibacter brevis]|uniref:Carbon-nitrogen hydrolase family protein n=1 Tax=Congregibacter brevis TaxID=3081201 RepID=A0ABZ0I908_9GAMM|nr:carbon-nitrogen hydrolase family protein [Congregibacter sp. IMCC45268]
MEDKLSIAIAQIAPVWLNKSATINKVESAILEASAQNASLVCFGETLLPGYPFWLDLTGGSKFNDPVQKEIFAHYLSQAVSIEEGDLGSICSLAKEKQIAVYLGIAERAGDRGGHSVYCSLVYIDRSGLIQSVHRKLMPTYEERLSWSIGDGHGLRVHSLESFTVGGLNCWENWMPMARSALYAQGENLHVAVWPGNTNNTIDVTRHLAKENRMYVLSVSGLMRREDIGPDVPHHDLIFGNAQDFPGDGGSCIAAPDGSWIVEPLGPEETVLTAVIDMQTVREERQNFDPSGHYSRPDVFELRVNRERQKLTTFSDEKLTTSSDE